MWNVLGKYSIKIFCNYSPATVYRTTTSYSLVARSVQKSDLGRGYEQLLSYTLKWRGRGGMRYWKSNGRVGSKGKKSEEGEVERGKIVM